MSDDAIEKILHNLKYNLAEAMDSEKPSEPAIKEAAQQIRQFILDEISSCYEMSLTDVEKYEYQNKVEMPIISKTELIKRFKLREPMD